jgi:tetratricopeptide (TPR) repeat protein
VSARTRVLDNVIKKETLEKHKGSKALEYAVLTAGSVAGIALFIYTVSGPLSTNLSLISALRNVPNNYATLAASSTANMKTYSSAIEANSFGQVEAREQLIQQAAKMVGVDTSKLQGAEKVSVDKVIADYKSYAESQFESMIAENETARNTSFYGSYLRQTGQYKKAEDYMARAHKLSPNKQLISFEYITALSANGKNKEALDLAKKVYESEPTFQTSKDIYDSIKQIISSSTVKVIKK